MKHKLQYGDNGPDWCIHCGTFAQNMRPDDECDSKQPYQFDASKPQAKDKLLALILGDEK